MICPYVFHGFKWEIHCHSLSKCCFPVGKVSFLPGCFQDFFFPLKVWLWHFLAWISLGLSCHDSRSFLNQICKCMPFAKFGEISSYYIFEFYSPTLFLISSGILVMQILDFLWLPHMVLGFFQSIFSLLSDWVISIDLSFSSLILLSVISILPSSEIFFISLIVLLYFSVLQFSFEYFCILYLIAEILYFSFVSRLIISAHRSIFFMTDDLKSLSENHNIWFVLASASADCLFSFKLWFSWCLSIVCCAFWTLYCETLGSTLF